MSQQTTAYPLTTGETTFPRFAHLTAADKARDWRPDISSEDYTAAKSARKEMLGTIAHRGPRYKGTGSISKASKIGIRSRAKAK